MISHSQRRIFNFLRERNVSGYLSLAKLLTLFASTSGKAKVLALTGPLSHFSRLPAQQYLVNRAIEYSREQNSREAGVRAATVALNHCMVLKPFQSASERGVLLISFEKELDKIVANPELLGLVESRYQILFLPSWTGLFSPALLSLTARATQDFYVLPVHANERELVKLLGPLAHPLPFNAASWVNEDLYQTPGLPRDIDCLLVANFASFKRHWLLFKALQGLPDSVSAVCVGVPLGSRTRASLEAEAAQYGVRHRVEIIENPPQELLREYFQRAKVFCAMSYREGSFIAVAEALVSGTPVVMFKNAHIGTRELIDNRTGALVGSVRELRKKILRFLEEDRHDEVRKVAAEHVGARANSRLLNGLLKEAALKRGELWTQDIEPFYSMRLSFYYYSPDAPDLFKDDYQFLKQHGVTLKGSEEGEI